MATSKCIPVYLLETQFHLYGAAAQSWYSKLLQSHKREREDRSNLEHDTLCLPTPAATAAKKAGIKHASHSANERAVSCNVCTKQRPS